MMHDYTYIKFGIKYYVCTILPLTFLSYRSPLLLFSPISFMSSLLLWIFHSLFLAFLSSFCIPFFPFHSLSVTGFCVVSFALRSAFFFFVSSSSFNFPCFLPLLFSFSVSLHFRISFFPIFFLPTGTASNCGFKGQPIKVATYVARSPWKRFAEFSNKR